MPSFRDKKIHNLFEPGGLFARACIEDLALAVPLVRQHFDAALLRVRGVASSTDVDLDPLLSANSTPHGKAETAD